MVKKVVAASQNPLVKHVGQTGRRAASEGNNDDDGESVAGSDYSFSESVRGRFWPGELAERHYRFTAKLRDTLYERYKPLYCNLSGTARLFTTKVPPVGRYRAPRRRLRRGRETDGRAEKPTAGRVEQWRQ